MKHLAEFTAFTAGKEMDALAPELLRYESEGQGARLPQRVLPAELDFYESRRWCLNPHLTVHEVVDRLHGEINGLASVPPGWQCGEVVTNLFLLSCGLLNSVEEYLRGPGLRLPWRLAAMPLGRGTRWIADNVVDRLRLRSRAAVRRWRNDWLAGLNDFLAVVVAGDTSEPTAFAEAGAKLALLLRSALPRDLQAERLAIPSAFRRLDLTHLDALALGRCYVRRFPDRLQPILLVGLRTSGSYFAPLLQAFLQAKGYAAVSLLTLAPSKGPGRRERQQLKRYAEQAYTAVILDDAPHTGGTILTAFDIVRRAGFGRGKARALVPTHPAGRNWSKPLPDDVIVTLEPELWHKQALLDPKAVESRLAEYFRIQNFVATRVILSSRAEEFNARLQSVTSDERGTRLKRIFEVRLVTDRAQEETRYVLAKSVGWGWLGYHGFLAGHRLAGFVPPILGLRDGILYTEWIPQPAPEHEGHGQRNQLIDTAASYVAVRVRCLNFATEAVADMDLPRQDNGLRLLAKTLSKAYGIGADMLMQGRLGRALRRTCPFPTLIDGNMQRAKWIAGSHGPLKTDYEHHGLGKEELNVIDPTYDLADTVLKLELSPEEENRLIRRYVDQSGDVRVGERLFMNKLLAGLWTMKQAQEHLFGKTAIAEGPQAVHRRFMSAWNFLTVQTARYCGDRCRPAAEPRWRSPTVMLDIDGIIDRRLFGFPCTTAAGMEALRLLHAHELSVAVNSARSVAEVKAYCQAYALAGERCRARQLLVGCRASARASSYQSGGRAPAGRVETEPAADTRSVPRRPSPIFDSRLHV